MIECSFCNRPLVCAGCQTAFVPRTQEQYEMLFQVEEIVDCPVCEAVLVCQWCKTAYDGGVEEETDG